MKIWLCFHPCSCITTLSQGSATYGIYVKPSPRASFICLLTVVHPSRQSSNVTSTTKSALPTHFYPTKKLITAFSIMFVLSLRVLITLYYRNSLVRLSFLRQESCSHQLCLTLQRLVHLKLSYVWLLAWEDKV